jgi:hypothetical protein
MTERTGCSLPLRHLTLVRGLVKPEPPVGKAAALV